MPIIIKEVVITTHIEKSSANPAATEGNSPPPMEDVVKQAVEKVMEILEEKKQR